MKGTTYLLKNRHWDDLTDLWNASREFLIFYEKPQVMKLSGKKMKAVWNWNEIDNEIFMKCTYDILLQLMSEAQHLNEWETQAIQMKGLS